MINIASNSLLQKNVSAHKLHMTGLNNIATLLMVCLLSSAIFVFPNKIYQFNWLWVSSFEFAFEFKIDMLSKIMFAVVMFIASQVTLYSRHYMLSDFSYKRFLLQLGLTVGSVQWLVLSGNLLTAFVGWQMIGLNLYLLLNHYHYKASANRNAKKKFIINRVGDVCFLAAVVLAMMNIGNTSFDQLIHIHDSTTIFNIIQISNLNLILCLVFVAIITKSALFPFHIWLPDTMEAPTPVSALMHAGVINSGGYLLARLSNVIVHETHFMLFVFTIGVITLITGVLIKSSQNNIKRTLAYSTMSQMGYMIMQIGLGCFSAAVFHLITHGLFKSFLFLNSGSFLAPKNTQRTMSAKDIVVPALISATIFFGFNGMEQHLTILDAFIFVALNEMISYCYKAKLSTTKFIVSIICVTSIMLIYYGLLAIFEHATLLGTHHVVESKTQTFIAMGVVMLYALSKIAAWVKLPSNFISKTAFTLSNNKLYIESMYRNVLIKPLRATGDLFNQGLEHINSYALATLSIGLILIMIQLSSYSSSKSILVSILICLSIVAHISANRATSLNKITLMLLIGQCCLLGCLGIYEVNLTLISLLAINLILLFSILLNFNAVNCASGKNPALDNNTLSTEKTIFTGLLFLIIGLPFTPCFLLWVLLIQSSIESTPLLTPFILLSNIILCISVFHSFQDYVFTERKLIKVKPKLKKFMIYLGILLTMLSLSIFFF